MQKNYTASKKTRIFWSPTHKQSRNDDDFRGMHARYHLYITGCFNCSMCMHRSMLHPSCSPCPIHPLLQINNSPHYPRCWAAGTFLALLDMSWALSILCNFPLVYFLPACSTVCRSLSCCVPAPCDTACTVSPVPTNLLAAAIYLYTYVVVVACLSPLV
jgi:hypothetical protein